MNPTIEIKSSDHNCVLFDTIPSLAEIPPGLYRLVDEAKIEELWKGFNELQVTIGLFQEIMYILHNAGLSRKEPI
jgi:hypothetical protein